MMQSYEGYSSVKQYIIYNKTIEAREAKYADMPELMLSQIKDYLDYIGIHKLYTHQAEMFNAASDNKNVVITTSTASGKTLSFLLPVLQDILKNPRTRAIFIYPTKALASDQYRAMLPLEKYFGKNNISIGVYDGDTPVNERSRIRNSANIILTNPEMLNTAFLPHHHSYGFDFIFSNLKYVVVDELHTYRGAFGSHMANIFRRLNRVCRYYSSSPQYLCSSATIANPVELAENIFGKEFYLIDNDGSPAPQKQYYLIQPPIIKNTNIRVSISNISANLVPDLVIGDRNFINFCKSRKAVEIILKEAREKLRYDGFYGQDYSDLIAGYRGGYKPQERKEIEEKMVTGKLHGVISTNALELGIDIGKVDTAVLTGYPGTRASFWQQSGRAGRNGKTCDTFLILDNKPFDQYLSIEPDWLFENSSENAVIDKNNLLIQIAHVRAAAAELPLTLDDINVFPDLGEILPVLLRAGELKKENGKFVWCGREFPAGDYSLRNIDKQRYQLVNSETNSVVTEMDETQAFHEIYEGAIYMHEGQSYQVLSLDLNSKKATAEPTDENFYTDPFCTSNLSVIKEQKTKPIGRTLCHFGDVNVAEVVGGYKKLQFHNHNNLGFQKLNTPLIKEFETEGVWIDIPQNVIDVFNSVSPAKLSKVDGNFYKSYHDGLCFALLNSAMMTTMTSNGDIGADMLPITNSDTRQEAACIYDLFTGGLGYADKAYDVIDHIVKNAIKMVSGCKCKDGCPACVGDYHLDKKIVLWGLQNIYEELTPPVDVKIAPVSDIPIFEKPFSFETLNKNWAKFIEYLRTKGERFSDFLTSVKTVKTDSNKLIFIVDNEFVKTWVLDEDNKKQLKNMLSQHIKMPMNFDIDVKVDDSEKEDKRDKLVRRYNNLTRK